MQVTMHPSDITRVMSHFSQQHLSPIFVHTLQTWQTPTRPRCHPLCTHCLLIKQRTQRVGIVGKREACQANKDAIESIYCVVMFSRKMSAIMDRSKRLRDIFTCAHDTRNDALTCTLLEEPLLLLQQWTTDWMSEASSLWDGAPESLSLVSRPFKSKGSSQAIHIRTYFGLWITFFSNAFVSHVDSPVSLVPARLKGQNGATFAACPQVPWSLTHTLYNQHFVSKWWL